jgi:hypothetical protein
MKLSNLSGNVNYKVICETIAENMSMTEDMLVFTTNIFFSKSLMQQTYFETQTQANLLVEINTYLNRTDITQENLFNVENKSCIKVTDDVTTITINFQTYKDLGITIPFVFIYQVVS